jgi:hypothetical protein
MERKYTFKFYSSYYRDTHFFLSELFQFLKDFYEELENYSHLGGEGEPVDVHIGQIKPPSQELFTTFEYVLTSYEEAKDLIPIVQKDVMNLVKDSNDPLVEVLFVLPLDGKKLRPSRECFFLNNLGYISLTQNTQKDELHQAIMVILDKLDLNEIGEEDKNFIQIQFVSPNCL